METLQEKTGIQTCDLPDTGLSLQRHDLGLLLVTKHGRPGHTSKPVLSAIATILSTAKHTQSLNIQ